MWEYLYIFLQEIWQVFIWIKDRDRFNCLELWNSWLFVSNWCLDFELLFGRFIRFCQNNWGTPYTSSLTLTQVWSQMQTLLKIWSLTRRNYQLVTEKEAKAFSVHCLISAVVIISQQLKHGDIFLHSRVTYICLF